MGITKKFDSNTNIFEIHNLLLSKILRRVHGKRLLDNHAS